MTLLARVERDVVDGEVVAVRLHLVRDTDVVELSDGDEFVSVDLAPGVDPWRLSG